MAVWLAATGASAQLRLAVNHDMERAFDDLQARLAALAAAYRPGSPPLGLEILAPELARLRQAVARNAESRLRLNGSALWLEADNQRLFGKTPALPPERKRDGRWTFRAVQFRLVPRNLYVYGVRFKASRTIRLRAVRLFFEGGGRTDHEQWLDLENGNGAAFRKREYLPALPVYGPDEPRRAKRLESIEILGSAQDAGFEAELDFMFEVPEPGERPYQKALTQLDAMTRTWKTVKIDGARLARCARELAELAQALGLETDQPDSGSN